MIGFHLYSAEPVADAAPPMALRQELRHLISRESHVRLSPQSNIRLQPWELILASAGDGCKRSLANGQLDARVINVTFAAYSM